MNHNIRKNRIRTFGLAKSLILAGCLGACGPMASHYTGAELVARPSVEMVRLTHNVRLQDGTFAPGELEALNSFLYINQVGYGDSIGVDAGSGFDEPSKAALTTTLRKSGLVLSGYRPVAGSRPANGTVTLVVDRYIATPPACPNHSQDTSPNYTNAPDPNFGCATMTNLSLMVANPRDLIEGQEFDGVDATTSNKAIKTNRDAAPAPLVLPNAPDSSAGGGGGGGTN